MKRLLLLTMTVAAALSGLSAFAQGNFVFSSGQGFVWNNTVAPIRGGPFNAAFLWANGAGQNPMIDGMVPTNNATGGGAQGPAVSGSQLLASWSQILTDPLFQLARDASAGDAIAVGTLNATGGIVYNFASPFGVTGTSTDGGIVTAYFIAWDNAYATPAAAAAAGANVGWSNPFTYTYGSIIAAPVSMGNQSITGGFDARFGVGLVPEPSTLTLAGLGAVAMLIIRRRK